MLTFKKKKKKKRERLSINFYDIFNLITQL